MSESHGGVGGSIDPSKLHLSTQIRKAARVLRDPGTTSSYRRRSPLAASSSSSFVNASNHQNDIAPRFGGSSSGNRVYSSDSGAAKQQKKKNRVFLHNWKNNSDKSLMAADIDTSLSSVRGSLEEDTSTDDAHGDDGGLDSKSGDSSCIGDGRYRHSQSDPFRRRGGGDDKKKSKKLRKHQQNHSFLSVRKSGHSGRLIPGNAHSPSMCLGFGRDDSASLVDLSDDTEDYCDSEDFRRISAASPLLSRLRYSNSPSKLLVKSSRKEDSSYTYNSTPALSTSSYNNQYGFNNPNHSIVGLWDCTTTSSNGGGDNWADDDHLDFPSRQGCGIPFYWSRRSTPKHRVFRSSSCSPSLSDTLRRKGSSMLCGSQTMYRSRCRRAYLDVSNKRKIGSRTAQGVLPLLTNGSSMGTGGQSDDDDLSTNFGELDLEALSRLDGRRWSSSCRSEEALELQALTAGGDGKEESTPVNIRSLSQKYRPMFFDELIGHNIVVQSLTNATSKGRIAPIYLFQGHHGTGKTSAARIFAAALNCLATEKTKPCGICTECTDFLSSKSRDLMIIDGTSKKAVDEIKFLLKNLSVLPQTVAFSRYKVFVIDECHLLPSKMWVPFLKFLEVPLPRVVFVFITTDLDSMPRTVLSRCQKYLFNKIKDCDIVDRLKKISDEENLDIELDALDLIALNADGSLRDAETMLDQLSLLGKSITTSLVNELLGVVSDDKLLELLELAMSPDTAETVKRARELLDSGVDPTVIMSQMASLIMDLIAGTYTNTSDLVFGGRSLTEIELERLKNALKLLSDAEKQLRVSSERSTWFTAALLQLGSVSSSEFSQSGSSRRQSSKTTEEDPLSASKAVLAQKHNPDGQCVPQKPTSSSVSIPYNGNYTHHRDVLSLDNLNSKPRSSQLIDGCVSAVSHDDLMVGNMIFSCVNSGNLDDIWTQCIGRCHSKTLRQLLHAHGKLLSISEVKGSLIAYIAFKDGDIKSRAERFLSSMTDSIETILRCNVEVRIILFSDAEAPSKRIEFSESLGRKQGKTVSTDREGKSVHGNRNYSDRDLYQEPIKSSIGSVIGSENNLKAGTRDYSDCSPSVVAGACQPSAVSPLLAGGNTEIGCMRENKQGIPMQRIKSIIRDQKLETAWLQTSEKGNPAGSMSRLKPEKNQVLPQDGTCHQSRMGSMSSKDLSSGQWEDELNHEIIVSNINDGRAIQKDQISKRVDRYPMSPSLLHDTNFLNDLSKDTTGYDSGAGTGTGTGGCNAFFCWNNTKNHTKGKVKRSTPVRRRFVLFGECGLRKKR